MVKITDLHEALQLVLTKSATEQGEKSGWQQRHGQISASQFVQTVAFGFLEDPHATLGHLARVAGTLGAAVTPQAISQRFTKEAVALLRGVVKDALGILLEADPVEVDWLQQFPGGVYLNDSTQITWHADWAATWDGGRAAALKLPTLLERLAWVAPDRGGSRPKAGLRHAARQPRLPSRLGGGGRCRVSGR